MRSSLPHQDPDHHSYVCVALLIECTKLNLHQRKYQCRHAMPLVEGCRCVSIVKILFTIMMITYLRTHLSESLDHSPFLCWDRDQFTPVASSAGGFLLPWQD
ncbi:hypothetical protein Y032_0035g3024 [Ancylostoma ceylanicum]|uniref:Uncharacterized protein n=1 Tax=Ancylostoma ceylanicum TaxID=53326 RepID=A0A016UN04_9BILA|nr:hypothetical protein Y032_0035g3024 [Ancylostoma ceylanicum]